MKRSMLIPLLCLTSVAAAPALAKKPKCNDAQGDRTPCTTAQLAPATACKDKDGRLAKCGTSGAVAMPKKEKKALPKPPPQ